MTTLTAPRRSTSNRPRTSTVLVSAFVIVIIAVTAALIVARLTSTPTVSHPVEGLTYTGGGGGSESHGHISVAAALSAQSAVAAERVVAYQKLYLQQMVDRQTRLIDRATPRDTPALRAMAAQVAAAQKALTNALHAQQVAQAH